MTKERSSDDEITRLRQEALDSLDEGIQGLMGGSSGLGRKVPGMLDTLVNAHKIFSDSGVTKDGEGNRTAFDSLRQEHDWFIGHRRGVVPEGYDYGVIGRLTDLQAEKAKRKSLKDLAKWLIKGDRLLKNR